MNKGASKLREPTNVGCLIIDKANGERNILAKIKKILKIPCQTSIVDEGVTTIERNPDTVIGV